MPAQATIETLLSRSPTAIVRACGTKRWRASRRRASPFETPSGFPSTTGLCERTTAHPTLETVPKLGLDLVRCAGLVDRDELDRPVLVQGGRQAADQDDPLLRQDIVEDVWMFSSQGEGLALGVKHDVPTA